MANFMDLWVREGMQYLREFEEQMGQNISYNDHLARTRRYMKILWQLENPYAYWSTPNNIVYEHQILKLRHFPSRQVDRPWPILVLPPMAGHHANICDYSPQLSMVRVFQRYGYDVYVCHWLSCTPPYKNLGLEDLIRLTGEAVAEVLKRTGKARLLLVGECQGGWQASVYTALFPDQVAALVAAAAPIDVSAAVSDIKIDAQAPMEFFEYLVAIGGGMMDGEYILWGFKNMQPEEHYIRKYYALWRLLESGREEELEAYVRFQNWFEYTQKLPGRFYLDVIKNVFKENNLVREGALNLFGRWVDLRHITCPVVIMAGQKDHITPPAQAFALKDHIGTASQDIVEVMTEGAHIGTLAGNQSLGGNWTAVNEVLKLI